MPCEGSATGTPEVDSAGDSVRTETIFTRNHQPGRKPAGRRHFHHESAGLSYLAAGDADPTATRTYRSRQPTLVGVDLTRGCGRFVVSGRSIAGGGHCTQ